MGLLSGAGLGAYKSIDRTNFYATAGQTTFTLSQGYSVGDIDVFLNGVRLVDADDYFATNGSTVVLASGAALNDHLLVVSYNQFSAANTYTKAEADTRYMVATGLNPMTSYLRTPNYGVSSWSDSASASLEASVGSGEQGVGVKAFGRSVATNGGDILYTADNRGVGGRHRFGYWNGTTFTQTMSLDSVGRMTLPYQPAFQAYNAQGQYITGATEAAFNSTYVNTGGHYSTTTGRFTAPVAGRYMFHFDGLFDNITSNHHISMRKNGVQVDGSEGYSDNVNQCIVKAMVWNLAVGDYISIFVDTASSRIHQRYGSFCGYFIG